MPEAAVRIDADGAAIEGLSVAPADAWATVVLAHGAGAGMAHPFMVGVAHGLAGEGVATLRFDFPYITAGRKFPDRPPAAIAAWRAAFAAATGLSSGPVWAAGKSFGGRMASMAVAEGMPAAGLVYLGYPLHPPGKPDRLRTEHLPAIAVPQLFLQGTKDAFATPALLAETVAGLQDATLDHIDSAGHSFEVAGKKRPHDEIGAALAPRIAAFIRARVGTR